LPGDAVPGGNAQFSLLSFALRACYQARLASFELGPCAGAEGGLLRATLQVAENGASGGSAPLFAPEAGFLVGWRFLPAWSVFARADVLLQTNRPEFTVNGATRTVLDQTVTYPATTILQPSLFTARGSLGVELRF
jgi:hypothetical protein